MRPKWTGDAKKIMHIYEITEGDLAKQMGVTRQWISFILNGRCEPQGVKKRVMVALDELTKD